MPLIAGLLGGREWILILMLCSASFGGGYYLSSKIKSSEISSLKLEWSEKSRAATALAAAQTTKWQSVADDSRRKLDAAKKRIDELDSLFATTHRDVDRLRKQIRGLGYGAPEESISSCKRRSELLSESLGESAGLLAEGRAMVREFAKAHDERAVEVDSLLEAWPK